MFLALLFFLSIKEDAALWILGFCYSAYKCREYNKLFIIIITTLSIVLINLLYVQPYFVAKSHFLQPATLAYWSQWGTTKTAILYNMLTHPIEVLSYVFDKKSGIWFLYLPCLFIPLLDLFTLLSSLPTILLFTTNKIPITHALTAYYPILLATLLFIGIIHLYYRTHAYKTITRLFVVLLLVYPLIGSGWLQIKAEVLLYKKELNQLKQDLSTQARTNPVCVTQSAYPYFSRYLLNLKILADKRAYLNLTKNSCNIIYYIPEVWPIPNMQTKIMQDTCKNYGAFSYCRYN
jgi:hypothetical protein